MAFGRTFFAFSECGAGIFGRALGFAHSEYLPLRSERGLRYGKATVLTS